MDTKTRLDKMEKIFSPRSVAFIGASNNMGKWGGIIFRHLVTGGYEGVVYPVNPKEETVQGIKAYKSIADIPGPADLAIFSIPERGIDDALEAAVKKGVPAGIVITAGFAELGEEGARLQEEMVAKARAGGMVLVGPNGQGVASPHSSFFPWMPFLFPKPGAIGIASQSGNVATVLCEQLDELGFGVSKAVSAGNCADLGWADYLEYFRRDPQTRVVLLYVEGVRPGFMEAAKRTALDKPVVVMKTGRSEEGARAVSSHTGVLAGADAVFSAACEQAGVLRVDTLEEAVMTAVTFIGYSGAPGPRLGVVTGGGGYGVIAADAAARMGVELPALSPAAIEKLKEKLPPWWVPNNPVDMVAGLGYGGPRELIPILMESGDVDGVLMLGVGWIYSMLDTVDSKIDFRNIEDERLRKHAEMDAESCDALARMAGRYGKPLLMTSTRTRLAARRGYPGLMRIIDKGLPLYPTIEDAVRAFRALSERHAFLEREGALEDGLAAAANRGA